MQYWIGLAALAQGLGGMQKVPSGIWDFALLHTRHVRNLQMMMPASSTTSTSIFGESVDDETSKMLGMIKDQCHLDVEELFSKVALIVLTSDTLNSPPTSNHITGSAMNKNANTEEVQEPSAADQVALVNLINDAVAPTGERQCTKAQNMQYIKASEKLASCVGLDLEKTKVDLEHLQELAEKCQEPAVMVNPSNCTDALLSEQIIVGALRDLYQHPGKYCSCLQKFKDDLPSCTLSVGGLIDASGEKTPKDFDEAYRDMRISLGFMKSYLCVVGLSCDALKDICVDQLNELEQCLSENPACDSENESEALSMTCQGAALFVVPLEISQGQVPDICMTALEDNKMSSTVISDYANFAQACHPEVMTVAATKQDGKPSMGKSSGWIDSMVMIGLIAVAVFGFVLAVVFQMRKQEKVDFKPLNTDEVPESELEELS